MLRMAEAALVCATAVLFGGRPAAADSMTAADRALHELRDEMEDQATALLGGDSSAALDMRTVVTGVHVGRDLEHMADLTRQIAEIAWSRLPERPFPARLSSLVEDISRTALAMMGQAVRAAESAGTAETAAVAMPEAGLREIGRQQQLLDRLLCDGGMHDIRDAVDATLLSQCYEGCARHALAAARRLVLLVDALDG